MCSFLKAISQNQFHTSGTPPEISRMYELHWSRGYLGRADFVRNICKENFAEKAKECCPLTSRLVGGCFVGLL